MKKRGTVRLNRQAEEEDLKSILMTWVIVHQYAQYILLFPLQYLDIHIGRSHAEDISLISQCAL